MPFASGGRLKVRVDDAGGGATRFLGIFDAERGEACAPGLDAEGTLRCLPESRRVVYGDPVCTKRLGRHVPGQPLVVASAEPSGAESCEAPRYRVHELGQAFSLPQAFDWIGEQCAPIGVDPQADYRLLGAELPSSAFASLELELEQGTPARRFARSSDGFELLVDVIDAHGDRCVPTRAEGGAVCATTEWSFYAQSGAYADPACSQALAYVAGPGPSACAPHVVVETEWTAECGPPKLTPYELEGPLGQVYYQDGSCEVSVGPAPSQSFGYFSATPLDEGALPTLSELELGSGPAFLRVLARDGAPVERSGGLVDRESQQPCAPVRFVDGFRRCVPSVAATAGDYYADAACSAPLAFSPYLDPCSDALELFAVERDPETGLVESVRQVLGPYYGELWRRSGELCEPVDYDLDLRALGEPLPHERFATVVERVLE